MFDFGLYNKYNTILNTKKKIQELIVIFATDGPAPGVLQQVSVPIWSNAVCKERYGYAAPGGILDSVLCAGLAARDSCSVSIFT